METRIRATEIFGNQLRPMLEYVGWCKEQTFGNEGFSIMWKYL